MASSFRFHPEAEDELKVAIAYLRERTLWQASRLADAFEIHLRQLMKHPGLGHFVWRQCRRSNINGTAHAVIYQVLGDELYIVAFAHSKRHPDYWKHRIDEDMLPS